MKPMRLAKNQRPYDPLANPGAHPWGHAVMTLGVGIAVGGVIGAVTNDKCEAGGGPLFCGPGFGFLGGAVVGGLATTAGAGIVGVLSPGKREESFRVAGLGAAIVGVLAIINMSKRLGAQK